MNEAKSIKAFIFDLDGTLVTSDIDFAELQNEIGCDVGGDVLRYAASQKDEYESARIMSVIEKFELNDAEQSQLIDGALRFVSRLQNTGFPLAVVTRNFRAAASRKIARAQLPIPTEWLVTREDAPPKPAPDALLMLATKWQLLPHEVAYVGDYHFDVDAALNASMVSCLRLNEYSRGTEYAERAHYCFESYDQFMDDFFDNRH
ncbi:MAG: HAD-IA family hydrolase [Pseudomonadales bacterium]|nr:HAD-IA family hydrolase [Pseudomonadales bacterium]